MRIARKNNIRMGSVASKIGVRSLLMGWLLIFVMISSGVFGQETTDEKQKEMSAYEKGVAYKKEIGRDVSTWQWNIPVELPNVEHHVIHSKSMNHDVGYNIYLPPGYKKSTTTRYPVVYYCHGASGSESSDTRVTEFLNHEIESGNIGEVIYVFPNAGHFGGYRDNPENNVMAESLIIKELIPEIDSHFRTIPERTGRALMGFSMGGGGATRLGLKYPDLFCAIASFSGSLDRNPEAPQSENNPMRGFRDPENNAYHWVKEYQDKIRDKMGLYFVVGTQDRLYAVHPPFVAYLHELNIDFNYRVQSGMGHNLWGLMEIYSGDAMKFLASYYDKAQ